MQKALRFRLIYMLLAAATMSLAARLPQQKVYAQG